MSPQLSVLIRLLKFPVWESCRPFGLWNHIMEVLLNRIMEVWTLDIMEICIFPCMLFDLGFDVIYFSAFFPVISWKAWSCMLWVHALYNMCCGCVCMLYVHVLSAWFVCMINCVHAFKCTWFVYMLLNVHALCACLNFCVCFIYIASTSFNPHPTTHATQLISWVAWGDGINNFQDYKGIPY